jgi:hypothetical protein
MTFNFIAYSETVKPEIPSTLKSLDTPFPFGWLKKSVKGTSKNKTQHLNLIHSIFMETPFIGKLSQSRFRAYIFNVLQ